VRQVLVEKAGPSSYAQILGVTGTLDCLGQFEKEIVKDRFGISETAEAPSIYGDRRVTFRQDQDVYVEKDVGNWQRQVADQAKVTLVAGGSVLVFFEDEAKMLEFAKSEYAMTLENCDYSIHTVTTAHTTTQVDHYVTQATRAGQVTLLTRVHGRGLDFVCLDASVEEAGGMKVIQTYLSEEKREQKQITGRTARQDQGGFFQMILLQKELVRKFGVTDAEIATEQAKGTGMYDFLDAKRCEYCDTRAQRRRGEVEKAKAKQDLSMQFVSNLVQGQRDAAIRQLNDWA